MPLIQQRNFFKDEFENPGSTGFSDYILCAGGCDTVYDRSSMIKTPEGYMCPKCFDDLYATCAECGCMLHFDMWGECDNLRVGPDDVDRCVSCDRQVFSICMDCGRRTRRDSNRLHADPESFGREFCESCWNSRWFICTHCNEIHARRNSYAAPDDNLYCESCFSIDYFICSRCDMAFSRDEMEGWEGDPFCSECIGHADVWKVRPWSNCGDTHSRIGSYRCFGVEIETETCEGWREIYYANDWGCVYECSTPGKEFISPILHGDRGLIEIEDFCRLARNKNWTVDSSCGLHIHVDARDLSSDQCLHVAYAYRRTYELWKKFVQRGRRRNSMCGEAQYDLNDIRMTEHIEDFAEQRDRFEFVNWRSYLQHSSIEIRLYHGTLVAREICNWIKLHTRFVDKVRDMTFNEIDECFSDSYAKNWAGLVETMNDIDLMDYWRRKANRQGCHLAAIWDGEEATEVESEDVAVSVGCGNPSCSICHPRESW